MRFHCSLLCLLAALLPALLSASPDTDLKTYQDYFFQRFPGIGLEAFSNGAYAIDRQTRDNWEAMEEFPPYTPFIDRGAALWNTPFANGAGYADCFAGNPAQRRYYPRWDPDAGTVVTLPLAINRCREANGDPPLAYGRGEIASLLAYMSYESRGQLIDMEIPADDPRALAAYEQGKAFYFRRRGQLNFSCAHCHMESAGQHLRTDTISPALGQPSGWPTYRAEWGELGTLHRRFAYCNNLMRARPFELQGEEYRNLEYFLTHMSNGVPFNGPSSRK